MRLIDADKINFEEVFGGQSDFAKDIRESAQSLIDRQPTAFDKEKVINEIRSGVMAANDEYIETCDEYYHGMQEAHKNDWKIVEKGGIE